MLLPLPLTAANWIFLLQLTINKQTFFVAVKMEDNNSNNDVNNNGTCSSAVTVVIYIFNGVH